MSAEPCEGPTCPHPTQTLFIDEDGRKRHRVDE